VDTLCRFIQSAEDYFKTLEAAVQAEDFNSLQRSFHNLKGLAATVGAERLRDKAAALEKLAFPDQLTCLKERICELKNEFELLADFCHKFQD